MAEAVTSLVFDASGEVEGHRAGMAAAAKHRDALGRFAKANEEAQSASQRAGKAAKDAAEKAAVALKREADIRKMATDLMRRHGLQMRVASQVARKLEGDTRRLTASVVAEARMYDRADRELREYNATQRRAAGQMGLGASIAGNLTRNLVGLAAAYASVHAVLRGVGAAARDALEYDAQLTQLNTLAGVQVDLVEQWREQLLQMAGPTRTVVTELTPALFAIASGGTRGAEALDDLRDSAQAASLGLGSAEDIARLATAAYQAYGREAFAAVKPTDIIGKAAEQGSFQVSELVDKMGRSLPIAKAMGVEFGELGGAVAAFTKLGVNVDIAVTGIISLLGQLQAPGEQAKQTFRDIGTSAAELKAQIADDGLARTLVDLLAKLEASGRGAEEVIPNIRALTAALATAGVQGEDFVTITNDVITAQAFVTDRFRDTAGQAPESLAELRAEASALSVVIGTQLVGAVQGGFLPAVRDSLVATREWVSGNRELLHTLGAISGTALVELLRILGTVGQGVGFLAEQWRILAAVLLVVAAVRLPAVISALETLYLVLLSGGAAVPWLAALAVGLYAAGRAAEYLGGKWGSEIAAMTASSDRFRDSQERLTAAIESGNKALIEAKITEYTAMAADAATRLATLTVQVDEARRSLLAAGEGSETPGWLQAIFGSSDAASEAAESFGELTRARGDAAAQDRVAQAALEALTKALAGVGVREHASDVEQLETKQRKLIASLAAETAALERDAKATATLAGAQQHGAAAVADLEAELEIQAKALDKVADGQRQGVAQTMAFQTALAAYVAALQRAAEAEKRLAGEETLARLKNQIKTEEALLAIVSAGPAAVDARRRALEREAEILEAVARATGSQRAQIEADMRRVFALQDRLESAGAIRELRAEVLERKRLADAIGESTAAYRREQAAIETEKQLLADAARGVNVLAIGYLALLAARQAAAEEQAAQESLRSIQDELDLLNEKNRILEEARRRGLDYAEAMREVAIAVKSIEIHRQIPGIDPEEAKRLAAALVDAGREFDKTSERFGASIKDNLINAALAFGQALLIEGKSFSEAMQEILPQLLGGIGEAVGKDLGGELGGAVGGIIGTLVGQVLGGLFQRGADQATAKLKVVDDQLVGIAETIEGQMGPALASWVDNLRQTVNTILAEFGGVLRNGEWGVLVRNEGEGIVRVFYEGLTAEFESEAEAASFAAAKILTSGIVEGLSASVAEALRGGDFSSADELLSSLRFAEGIDAALRSPLEQFFAATMRDARMLLSTSADLGINIQRATLAAAAHIQALLDEAAARVNAAAGVYPAIAAWQALQADVNTVSSTSVADLQARLLAAAQAAQAQADAQDTLGDSMIGAGSSARAAQDAMNEMLGSFGIGADRMAELQDRFDALVASGATAEEIVQELTATLRGLDDARIQQAIQRFRSQFLVGLFDQMASLADQAGKGELAATLRRKAEELRFEVEMFGIQVTLDMAEAEGLLGAARAEHLRGLLQDIRDARRDLVRSGRRRPRAGRGPAPEPPPADTGPSPEETRAEIEAIAEAWRSMVDSIRQSDLAAAVSDAQKRAADAWAEALELASSDPDAYADAAEAARDAIERGLAAELEQIGADALGQLGSDFIRIAREGVTARQQIRFLMNNLEQLGLTAQQVGRAIVQSILPQLLDIAIREAERVGDQDRADSLRERRADIERRLLILQLNVWRSILEEAGRLTQGLADIFDDLFRDIDRPTAGGGGGGDGGGGGGGKDPRPDDFERQPVNLGGGQLASPDRRSAAGRALLLAQQLARGTVVEMLETMREESRDPIDQIATRFDEMVQGLTDAFGYAEERSEALALAEQLRARAMAEAAVSVVGDLEALARAAGVELPVEITYALARAQFELARAELAAALASGAAAEAFAAAGIELGAVLEFFGDLEFPDLDDWETLGGGGGGPARTLQEIIDSLTFDLASPAEQAAIRFQELREQILAATGTEEERIEALRLAEEAYNRERLRGLLSLQERLLGEQLQNQAPARAFEAARDAFNAALAGGDEDEILRAAEQWLNVSQGFPAFEREAQRLILAAIGPLLDALGTGDSLANAPDDTGQLPPLGSTLLGGGLGSSFIGTRQAPTVVVDLAPLERRMERVEEAVRELRLPVVGTQQATELVATRVAVLGPLATALERR